MSDSKAADEAVVLRYRAWTDAFFIGVPARDLTDGDLALIAKSGRFGKTKPTVLKRLAASGLYSEPKAPPTDAARKSAATAADREAN